MSTITTAKRIAILVDDSKRTSLIEWSYFNKEILSQHEIIANEITADLLKGTLNIPITVLMDGTVEGHRELTQMIHKKNIDILIFFGDPAKADIPQMVISDLLALAIQQNIIVACNLATADLIIGSVNTIASLQTNKRKQTGPLIPVSFT